MSWRNEWAAIAGRIESLLSAGHFLVRALGISSSDSYNVTDRHLGTQAREITANLRSFLDAHNVAIPQEAATAIRSFLQNYGHAIEDDSVKGLDGLKLRLTSLAAVRSAVEYHLSDLESIAHKRAERAFLHLRQTIVADESTRGKWENAFSNGEPACEKLGAAHLMFHGIWAFKVNAEGGRTDLIFGDTVDDADGISNVAEALVLTEWKIVKSEDQAESVANAAREQTRLYTGGILAGIELSRYRYIVLVSLEQLQEIPDVQEGSATYRHVNVPVKPVAPSRAARKRRSP